MRIRPASLLRLVLVLVPLAACAPAKTLYHHTSDDLGKAARLFNDYVRWGYVDKATDFILPAERAAFVDDQTRTAKSVRITDFHVGASDYPEKSQDATVIVTWTYYRNDQGTEQTKTITEHWKLRDLKWYVTWAPGTFGS
jgi:hypothetical protein